MQLPAVFTDKVAAPLGVVIIDPYSNETRKSIAMVVFILGPRAYRKCPQNGYRLGLCFACL